MPAHIYLRVGDWQSAVDANEHSVDHALQFRQSNNPSQERARSHCLDFLAHAYGMQGNFAGARKAAEDYWLVELPRPCSAMTSSAHRTMAAQSLD